MASVEQGVMDRGSDEVRRDMSRVRAYPIRNSTLIAILTGKVRIATALPADAVIGHVHADDQRQCIIAYVYSDEFPPVAEGSLIPVEDALKLQVSSDSRPTTDS
jgi:hypothetical protein